MHVYDINNSLFSVYFLLCFVCVLQTPLHGVQRLRAVLPDSASSPAAGAEPPPGALSQAGGAEPGGGGRPRPQLEGRTHDASDRAVLSYLASVNMSSCDLVHCKFIEITN